MTPIEIVEVAARDGLQNESKQLDTATKVELIERAITAGVTRIETTSFVHPKLVPAMADAEAVMAALPERPDVTYVGLVLNDRGLERAVAAGCDEVNVVVPVTDGFASANQNTTVAEAILMWHRLAADAAAEGLVALQGLRGLALDRLALDRRAPQAHRPAERQRRRDDDPGHHQAHARRGHAGLHQI